jgi:hypothetical protein
MIGGFLEVANSLLASTLSAHNWGLGIPNPAISKMAGSSTNPRFGSSPGIPISRSESTNVLLVPSDMAEKFLIVSDFGEAAHQSDYSTENRVQNTKNR